MSLNLWKLQKGVTSYNPLPTGYGNSVPVADVFKTYVMMFKAKSVTNAQLRVQGSGTVGSTVFTLSNTLTSYSCLISPNTGTNLIFLNDLDSKGDIIITDIQLVQKPLPKMTINGIDSFTSGKWTLHANARVIDDGTLELNATGNYQLSNVTDKIYVKPNEVYTAKADGGYVNIVYYDINNQYISENAQLNQLTFTTPSNCYSITFRIHNNTTLGTFIFKRPMLNLGTTPAPYEKKRGERMVLPTPKGNLIQGVPTSGGYTFTNVTATSFTTPAGGFPYYSLNVQPNKDYTFSMSNDSNARVGVYNGDDSQILVGYTYNKSFTFNTGSNSKINVYFSDSVSRNVVNPQLTQGTTATPYTPYAVQVNAKPKRYVLKKNLFDGQLELGTMFSATGLPTASTNQIRSINFINIKPTTNYFSSISLGNTGFYVFWYDINKTFIRYDVAGNNSSPSNGYFAKFRVDGLTDTNAKIQIEEGSTATPYEPYTEVLPRAKSGVAFNGVTDYLQLPSMTMDSIEIDCLIDSSDGIIVDMRNGLTDGWVSISGKGSSSLEKYVNGVLNGSFQRYTRIKFKIKNNTPFTDDVTLFQSVYNDNRIKGILYGVKCYLNGNIVAQYDVNTIIGDKLLQKAVNLIPSFEDSRWSLHANFKVLGKDIGRLDASANYQSSAYYVPVIPNGKYLFTGNVGNGRLVYIYYKQDMTAQGVSGFVTGTTANVIITAPSDAYYVRVSVDNGATTSGSFDFIKPSLYQLDGTEGTLVGSPTPLLKPSKRSLYSKR